MITGQSTIQIVQPTALFGKKGLIGERGMHKIEKNKLEL